MGHCRSRSSSTCTAAQASTCSVTDHVARHDDPWRACEGIRFRSVGEACRDDYVADIEREAQRASKTYGLLVIPNLELTFNDEDPVLAAPGLSRPLRLRALARSGSITL